MLKIEFDSLIYNSKALKIAVKDFQGLCKVELEEKSGLISCTFSNCKYDEAETAKEFGNYLIELMNCKI